MIYSENIKKYGKMVLVDRNKNYCVNIIGNVINIDTFEVEL
jgi:hypothetical protein